MRLSTVIRELNTRERHKRGRYYTMKRFGDPRAIEQKDEAHGGRPIFVCWAHPRDVRGLLEGMGLEYEDLIARLDREGLSDAEAEG